MVIGLTGGVGCGKSTVMETLERDFGAKILLADNLGHGAMAQGTDCYKQIIELFGEQILTNENEINRNEVAKKIYASDELRQQMNAIVHPYVLGEIKKQLKKWGNEPFVVVETAIMFESGCDALCDEIWGVSVAKELRIQRLMDSRNYTREKTESIMSKQMSDEEFERKCSCIIYNNGSVEELQKQLKELLHKKGIL